MKNTFKKNNSETSSNKTAPEKLKALDTGPERIAKAHNLVETRNDPTSHAEKLVIEKALKITGQKFLNNCDIWVTLEPCVMCAGIIKQTRIRRLYYGAEDKKGGAVDNGVRVFSDNKTPIEIYSGFSATQSERLLKDFFHEIR